MGRAQILAACLIFDREDALAVLGIAFCQRVFYNLVGLLTMFLSKGLLQC